MLSASQTEAPFLIVPGLEAPSEGHLLCGWSTLSHLAQMPAFPCLARSRYLPVTSGAVCEAPTSVGSRVERALRIECFPRTTTLLRALDVRPRLLCATSRWAGRRSRALCLWLAIMVVGASGSGCEFRRTLRATEKPCKSDGDCGAGESCYRAGQPLSCERDRLPRHRSCVPSECFAPRCDDCKRDCPTPPGLELPPEVEPSAEELAAREGQCQIYGRVFDFNTKRMLEGVYVSVWGASEREPVTTDRHGRYCIQGLEPGRYTLEFVSGEHFGSTTEIVLDAPGEGTDSSPEASRVAALTRSRADVALWRVPFCGIIPSCHVLGLATHRCESGALLLRGGTVWVPSMSPRWDATASLTIAPSSPWRCSGPLRATFFPWLEVEVWSRGLWLAGPGVSWTPRLFDPRASFFVRGAVGTQGVRLVAAPSAGLELGLGVPASLRFSGGVLFTEGDGTARGFGSISLALIL